LLPPERLRQVYLARLAQLHQRSDSGQQAAIWRECGVLACTRRKELQLKKKSAIAIKAKANSVASGERFGKGLQNSAEPIKAIDTRAEIAVAVGTVAPGAPPMTKAPPGAWCHSVNLSKQHGTDNATRNKCA